MTASKMKSLKGSPIRAPPTRTPYPSLSLQDVSSSLQRSKTTRDRTQRSSETQGSRNRDSVWLSGLGLDFYSTAAAIAPIVQNEASRQDGGGIGPVRGKEEGAEMGDGTGSTSHDKKRNSHLKERERHIRRAAAKSHGNLPETLEASESFINISMNDRTALRNAGSRASVGAGIGLGRSGSSGRVSVSAEKPGLEKKKRVQMLLARASVGFLEWGKSLAGRRHQSP
jgi:hypothetical protein